MSRAEEILTQELLCLAFCWRLDRRDGVTIGLTSHDRDMAIAGVVYHAAPGLVPSAITSATALEAQTMDLQGALTSDAISADDLEAGRWDGAMLRLHLTEWSAPGALWLELSRGELGAIERRGESFSAELRTAAFVLEQSVFPETSPSCRARLGDAACRVDLAPHKRVARIASVDDAVIHIAGGGLSANAYGFGKLRWLTGANTGLVQYVVTNDAESITLADAPARSVPIGTLVELTAGCDKRLETCHARFANTVNFRGEPFLPGSDLLTRYPGN